MLLYMYVVVGGCVCEGVSVCVYVCFCVLKHAYFYNSFLVHITIRIFMI